VKEQKDEAKSDDNKAQANKHNTLDDGANKRR
jgi:hypothetical protein